jgi:hypothetical protein
MNHRILGINGKGEINHRRTQIHTDGEGDFNHKERKERRRDMDSRQSL